MKVGIIGNRVWLQLSASFPNGDNLLTRNYISFQTLYDIILNFEDVTEIQGVADILSHNVHKLRFLCEHITVDERVIARRNKWCNNGEQHKSILVEGFRHCRRLRTQLENE